MEKHIQKKIVDWLRIRGAYVVKVSIASRSGVPDLLVCYKGLFIAIEVKDEAGRTTPLQDYNIESIIVSGGMAFVAKSVEEVERAFNHLEAKRMLNIFK
jgi:Holliday junction resolvase